MPEAVTTWRESLWVGETVGSLSEVQWVTSAPEIGDAPQAVDATNLGSDAMTYVRGLPDYSGDLVWELNAQQYSRGEDGNLGRLQALDGREVYAERRMPMAQAKVRVRGVLSLAMAGSEVNGIIKLTLRITPTEPYRVIEYTSYSGYAISYYSGIYVDGAFVSLEGAPSTMTRVYQGGSIGSSMPVRTLAYVSGQSSYALSVPDGYEMRGWCTDRYGEGAFLMPGDRAVSVDSTVRLYPNLVPASAGGGRMLSTAPSEARALDVEAEAGSVGEEGSR